MRPEIRGGLVGLAAGVLLSLLVGVLVWPDDETGADGVALPSSPSSGTLPSSAPPTSSASETATATPSDDGSEDSDEEDGDQEPEDAPPLADAAPAGEGRLPDASRVTCPAATVEVSDADELTDALASAQPGESIAMADGTYEGYFAATVSGTASDPIFLCGSADAVLDGGSTEDSGYVVHLDGASYWRLVGFTVTRGQKGVMTDASVGSVIQNLTVTQIGDEGIHLRDNSTDNVVVGNTVSDTGRRKEKYGEALYVGSAVSNWCSYTDCQADRSDRNVLVGNAISGTTSEAVDIKEGTTGGVLRDNVIDGSSIIEADSWVDVKGNSWLIAGNRGTAAPQDGFQTHEILAGWGDLNVFSDNSGAVDASGYGIALTPDVGNRVTCDNDLTGAAEGVTNISCS